MWRGLETRADFGFKVCPAAVTIIDLTSASTFALNRARLYGNETGYVRLPLLSECLVSLEFIVRKNCFCFCYFILTDSAI